MLVVVDVRELDCRSARARKGGTMRWKVLVPVLAMMMWPLYSEALTRDDFLVRTTQDLVKLCTANETDPMYNAATGFCHGYGVGAYHYYQASTDPGQGGFVCFPDPPPTRVEVLQMFLAWTKENPQSMNELAVNSLFRFLASKFPCRR
jgi:hypothetical protein